jgi:hypothetical protein
MPKNTVIEVEMYEKPARSQQLLDILYRRGGGLRLIDGDGILSVGHARYVILSKGNMLALEGACRRRRPHAVLTIKRELVSYSPVSIAQGI